ncbi:MAG: tRNA (N(6)-L-threonylcarbamoyladenosine(37)-C(2))-methylthiotransferase MtaB [Nannocystaceae bacterium]
MRVALTTLGCRLNHFETAAMARLAEEAGHTLVDGDAPADVHVVNTCAITHEADADSRQRIRQIARRAPGTKIVVTGCYADAEPEIVRGLPGVALVVGNRMKDRWLPALAAATAAARVDVVLGDLTRHRRIAELRPAIEARRSRALLKIQDGCNYRCAFCVVPSVRGRSVSLTPATIHEHLAELVAAGVPEVVLTGVHLGTYGWDRSPRLELVDLVAGLLPALGGARLRLGSLDPHELDDRLIELLAGAEGRICRHLHLPIQSGDDEVLRRMRRAHRAADLADRVPRLAARVPGIAVGTDVIVGFPGESEAAFDRTYALLESLPIAHFHVFPYSVRSGTEAATMDDPVAPADRARRSERLRGLSRRKWAAFCGSNRGAVVDAVVHRARDRRSGDLVALSDNFIKVVVPGDEGHLGRRVRVEILEVDGDRTRGRLVDG